jgi:TolB-like protein/Tfp pilus assembly protein PilF
MTENTKHRPIRIDLNQFKLHIDLKRGLEITLHFDSPSRRFYLSVIALVVNEMKRRGKITSIPLEEHHDLLALLNESVGGSAGSSKKGNLESRIYRKWKDALPNLEEAPLFKVVGRQKKYDEGAGRAYRFTETEKDSWANLFEYTGSEDKVRLKFAIDKIGARLDDVAILYEDSVNGDAWDRFLLSLKREIEKVPEAKPVQPISEAPEPPVSPPREEKRGLLQNRYRWIALIAAVVMIVGAATWGIWELAFRPAQANKASIERMAFPLPDVPSIAVLPFVNMSDDPKQEFLCDAITENIITALSKVPRFFVIARNSAFAYKEKQVKVKQVSEELGVRYVLEGSVQRAADRIRVTAQLIDALNGLHIWAERYDRNIEDLFALQDEITMKILTAAQVKLTGMGTDEAIEYEKSFKGKHGLDCYLKYWEAVGIANRMTIEGNKEVLRIGEEVTSMCPDSPDGYFLLALVTSNNTVLDTSSSREESLDKAVELMQKALAIDDTNGLSHGLLSQCYVLKREYDKAIAEGERAAALNPGGASTLQFYALALLMAGRYEEAITVMQKVMRLDPVGYAAYYWILGRAFLFAGRFEEAVSTFKKLIALAPDHILGHTFLAATYIMLGREEEARAEIAEVRRINPKFSVDFFTRTIPLKDRSKMDEIANALRKAGLE